MRKKRRKLRISLIGAGSVGTTLAAALYRSGHSIVSVISRRRSSARRCASLVDCDNYSSNLTHLPPHQDFILIAVPEDSLKSVVHELWRLNVGFNRMHVAHTSGVLSSDVLQLLRSRGARVFSFHPIQSFPKNASVDDRIRSLQGISYGFEGDRELQSFVRGLVRDLGGKLLVVPKEAKILYHLACVFASNYLVTLLGAVETLTSGFSKARSKDFHRLIETSVENALSSKPSAVLTGPIARGSVHTVKLHLSELKKQQRDLVPLYRSLGLLAVEFARSEKRISDRQVRELRKVLESR